MEHSPPPYGELRKSLSKRSKVSATTKHLMSPLRKQQTMSPLKERKMPKQLKAHGQKKGSRRALMSDAYSSPHKLNLLSATTACDKETQLSQNQSHFTELSAIDAVDMEPISPSRETLAISTAMSSLNLNLQKSAAKPREKRTRLEIESVRVR